MSARAPILKKCPASHCRWQSESDVDVRGHIIDVHRKAPEQMLCGEYTIKTNHYRRKHRENCGYCEPGSLAAPAVIPSIENDGGSDSNGTPEPDIREGEASPASQNRWMLFNGHNYGIIQLTVNGCSSSSRSCSGDSN
ncbi:uncharacterized protein ColSpa_12562 [Colletotrichum spaethianum]|uniref:Uncharacterized protein n=1 Tax=Colletotrichum spaethianum TaxID=700344 RepID=A0AA37ULQ8_9PEZI|nr:uncharacterized protein ColSpa_12562 [Colletotrichum spaethianum]GKT52381.1 hypothetical protein ColSpa_12562 [Colletotrichum spaethianum]